MDMNELMKMAGKLTEQMGQAQAEAGHKRFIGESGGGMVRVVISGHYEVLELGIDHPAVMAAQSDDDVSLLEDLVRAAINAALVQVTSGMKQQFGGMAQNLGIDIPSIVPSGTET